MNSQLFEQISSLNHSEFSKEMLRKIVVECAEHLKENKSDLIIT